MNKEGMNNFTKCPTCGTDRSNIIFLYEDEHLEEDHYSCKSCGAEIIDDGNTVSVVLQ